MRRKPRGALGFITLGSDPSFHPVALPDTKEEIEDWVLRRALAAAAAASCSALFRRGLPRRNPENHFDFTISSEGSDEYLDLMEIVILPSGAKGYEQGSPAYDAEEMAEAVFERVLRKSRHYGRQRTPVHLLLYATDWRFQIEESVTEPLLLMLARRRHGFASVSYFAPHDEEQGQFLTLFPSQAAVLEACAARQYEARSKGLRVWVMKADLRKGRVFPGGGRLTMK